MELEELFTIFGKENVKVLSADPEVERLILESKSRINQETEAFSEENRILNASALSAASRAYLTQ
ncbi:MAG: hypothetical protein GW761_01500 [Leptospira sp.]|jgi:hypothetical protein|nr:hypothetical protein [Leptospira sp.]